MKKISVIILTLFFCYSFIYSSEPSDRNNEYLDKDNLTSSIKSKAHGGSTTFKKVALYNSKKSYNELGEWLSKNIKNKRDLKNLYMVASELELGYLKNAITATKRIKNQKMLSKISTGDLLQVSLYIETNIKNKSIKKSNYFDENKTKLPRSIDVDKKNKNIIIYLDDKKSDKIGSGYLKNFNTALLYGVKSPKVITTGFLKVPKKNSKLRKRLLREIEIMKKLDGASGVVKPYSILNHKNISKKNDEVVFAEKLYTGGSVRELLSKKRNKFTLKEKIQLAADFISGLRAMHKKGIVHKDVHAGNFLVDIEKKKGKKKVSGVITDFGRARISEKSKGKPLSGSRSDIFHLGVVLYGLFNDKSILHRRDHKKIHKDVISVKRHVLKKRSEHSSLSTEDRFRYLIFNMMNKHKKEAKTIDEIYKEIKSIESSIESGK